MQACDLALVLAIDGSASVGYDEFSLIVDGCAAGLREPQVVAGLLGGPLKASLCSVLLWSGKSAQQVMLDWTRLGSAEEVARFADRLAGMTRAVRPGTTAIGMALGACETLLAGAPATAVRQVIDVAGDGRSNDGPPPGAVRDRLAARNVTINGLCVLHEEPDLVQSYTREVIGGPQAFALACADYVGFAEAMRRKLIRETEMS